MSNDIHQRSSSRNTSPMNDVNDQSKKLKIAVGTQPTKPQNGRIRSFFEAQSSLCTAPVIVLVSVASLDSADKSLLSSSFPALERTLGLDVETLGYFSLFTNLSYALSLPMWGFLVHIYGIENVHNLLSGACLSWGIATLGIAASGSSFTFQAAFRSINGVALASLLPLSQTLLVDMVPASARGRAFGFLGLCENLAGTIASASIVYYDNWQYPYVVLGLFSIVMCLVTRQQLTMTRRRQLKRKAQLFDLNGDDDEEGKGNKVKTQLTLGQIVKRIARIPAFMCLVAQGVFGGTPWDMMSYMLLLLDWRGFSKEQIVCINFVKGLAGTLGGYLGGALGDYMNVFYPTHGRIYVAFVSVAGGIPLYGLFLYATSFRGAIFWMIAFGIWAAWPPAAANRPICAELANNPSERAQIVSLWILLEKSAGAILGAPLVGYLTGDMISSLGGKKGADLIPSSFDKAEALAYNLFCLSALFWGLCSVFWLLMTYTYRSSIESQAKANSILRSNDRTEESVKLIL